MGYACTLPARVAVGRNELARAARALTSFLRRQYLSAQTELPHRVVTEKQEKRLDMDMPEIPESDSNHSIVSEPIDGFMNVETGTVAIYRNLGPLPLILDTLSDGFRPRYRAYRASPPRTHSERRSRSLSAVSSCCSGSPTGTPPGTRSSHQGTLPAPRGALASKPR